MDELVHLEKMVNGEWLGVYAPASSAVNLRLDGWTDVKESI